MEKGTRVIVTATRRPGLLLETRETPSGTSAKVKLDDARIASWYWLRQLAPEGAAQ